MICVIILFLVGLAILVLGAEYLVKGSVQLAEISGISRLVIGMTIVAFGTSAPELFIDLTAALHGRSQLAFGVLIGSNIANMGLILGMAALVRPIRIRMRILKVEVPLLITVSAVVWFVASDGFIDRPDGLLLLFGLTVFGLFLYCTLRREDGKGQPDLKAVARKGAGRTKSIILLVSGLVGLLAGAQLMVRSAVRIALIFGIEEVIIGMTVVAIGSSLPELTAALVASYRGESDIITGNVLGSNIFNLLAILPLVACVQPVVITGIVAAIDIPLMVVLTFGLIPIMLRGRSISRGEGGALAITYFVFIAWKIIEHLIPT